MALPDLRFGIRADEQTEKALTKVRSEVEKTRKGFVGMRGDIGMLRSLFAGFAGGLAFGVFNQLTRLPSTIGRVVAAADRLGDTAAKIGLTTDELQEMRFAAAQTGIAVTQLDMGMQRFSRRVAEAATGTGVLLPILKANNLALRDQDGRMRSVVDLLDDYADLIKNAGSEQEALLLAFKAFDSEGAAMVNALRGGPDELQRMRQEAHDTGQVMQKELVGTADIVADSWAAFTGFLSTSFSKVVLGIITDARTLGDVLQRLSLSLPGGGVDPMVSLRGGLTALSFQGQRTDFLQSDPLGFPDFRGAGDFGGAATIIPGSTRGGGGGNSAERRIDRVSQALEFQAEQLRRTARERFLHNQLQRAGIDQYHKEAPAIMAAASALFDHRAQIKQAVKSMDALRDSAKDVMSSFVSDLRQGESLLDSLGGAVDRLASKLLDSGLDRIVGGLFGAKGTAAAGGLFGGLFGGLGKLLGFQHGGSFVVGGAGGPDSQLVPLRLTPGERVDFTPPGRGGGATTTTLNINVHVSGARGNREVRDMVVEGVQAGIAVYDRRKGRRKFTHDE